MDIRGRWPDLKNGENERERERERIKPRLVVVDDDDSDLPMCDSPVHVHGDSHPSSASFCHLRVRVTCSVSVYIPSRWFDLRVSGKRMCAPLHTTALALSNGAFGQRYGRVAHGFILFKVRFCASQSRGLSVHVEFERIVQGCTSRPTLPPLGRDWA